MRKFIASFRSKLEDRKGVSAAEYAILAVGVVIVVGGAVAAFGPQLEAAFTNIGVVISSTQGVVEGGTTGGGTTGGATTGG
jgi:pilus assembly protein Flp/PilA